MSWLITVPANITDTILDANERVKVQVARADTAAQPKPAQAANTLLPPGGVGAFIDQQLAGMAMERIAGMCDRVDAIVAFRADIIKVCPLFLTSQHHGELVLRVMDVEYEMRATRVKAENERLANKQREEDERASNRKKYDDERAAKRQRHEDRIEEERLALDLIKTRALAYGLLPGTPDFFVFMQTEHTKSVAQSAPSVLTFADNATAVQSGALRGVFPGQLAAALESVGFSPTYAAREALAHATCGADLKVACDVAIGAAPAQRIRTNRIGPKQLAASVARVGPPRRVAIAIDTECSVVAADNSDRIMHAVSWVISDLETNAEVAARECLVAPTAEQAARIRSSRRVGFDGKFTVERLAHSGRPLGAVRAELAAAIDGDSYSVAYLVGYNLVYDLRAAFDLGEHGLVRLPRGTRLFDAMHAGPKRDTRGWLKQREMLSAMGLVAVESAPHRANGDARDTLAIFRRLLPTSAEYLAAPCRVANLRCKELTEGAPHYGREHTEHCPWSVVA